MGRSLALVVALILAACGSPPLERASATPTAGPSGAPTAAAATAAPPTVPPATVAPATATPAPTARAGAFIDLHELGPARGEYKDTVLSGQLGGIALTGALSGTWTSEWYEPGSAFTRVVPSWTADTPGGTFIRVQLQVRGARGESAFYSFGVWTLGDAGTKRSSADAQRDAFGRIETDTFSASAPLTAYRLRVTLYRASAGAPGPVVRSLNAVASDPASMISTYPSAPLGIAKDLDVPSFSQEIHAGEYPEYDGGGEAWCSPTSTAMVLAFWGKRPGPSDLAWIDPRYADPFVDHAARYTYDDAYGGTGNWPFNTAYAASFPGVHAFVTQLRSLAEAERFIAAGIPLVASVKVAPGALPGFLFPQGTNGHLLVIRGFTASGDVIANDPAARSNAAVRRVYPRAAFEKAWLGGSVGTVYVIRTQDKPLPDRVAGATSNW